jgi:hypothetical protein
MGKLSSVAFQRGKRFLPSYNALNRSLPWANFPQSHFNEARHRLPSYNAFVPVLPKAKLPLSAFQRGIIF